jgi:hypothetical protein
VDVSINPCIVKILPYTAIETAAYAIGDPPSIIDVPVYSYSPGNCGYQFTYSATLNDS